jgi:hypothetical protein
MGIALGDIFLRRRIFKTRTFARWSRKAGLPDQTLCAAVDDISAGLLDADLGGHVYKKRVPMPRRCSKWTTGRLEEQSRWVS